MPKLFTISDVKYIDPQTLKQWINNGVTNFGSKFVIIDVRDSDYVGGHIVESVHIPSSKFKDEQLPLLLNNMRQNGQETVVFHCMLSQQRGPSAAMKFMHYLNEELSQSTNNSEIEFIEKIKICILRGGFSNWQQLYGDDHRLTEEYDTRLWKFGL